MVRLLQVMICVVVLFGAVSIRWGNFYVFGRVRWVVVGCLLGSRWVGLLMVVGYGVAGSGRDFRLV